MNLKDQIKKLDKDIKRDIATKIIDASISGLVWSMLKPIITEELEKAKNELSKPNISNAKKIERRSTY